MRDSLRALIGGLENRVVLTTFASNIARLETAAHVAEAVGRHPAPVGRSMHRMIEAAREVGYLEELPPLLNERAASELPRARCCGWRPDARASRAALTRIAAGQHRACAWSPATP